MYSNAQILIIDNPLLLTISAGGGMENAFFLETNIKLHLASFRLRSLSSINVAILSMSF